MHLPLILLSYTIGAAAHVLPNVARQVVPLTDVVAPSPIASPSSSSSSGSTPSPTPTLEMLDPNNPSGIDDPDAPSYNPYNTTDPNSPWYNPYLPGSQGYMPGTCGIQVTEYQTCAADPDDLWATLSLSDGNFHGLATVASNNTNPHGIPIDVKDPYVLHSRLPNPWISVGEHQGDYIQFEYGDISFTSKNTRGNATCMPSDWDRSPPDCKVIKAEMKARVGRVREENTITIVC